jgi:predicted amidohydrolase
MSQPQPFTIGIIQDHATADRAANVARAERLVRDAARQGAQIVCLKECSTRPTSQIAAV